VEMSAINNISNNNNNNNNNNSKNTLLKILDDIINDKKINNHRKQSTEAESGLDEFENIVFQVLTKTLCVYEDLASLLMFLADRSEDKNSSLIQYSTDGGEVAVHPLLLSLLKTKIDELKIQHEDIKDLEKTFFLYVGMQSDEYSDDFYNDKRGDYSFQFDLYSSGFEQNPIRDIASKALHILALLSHRLYNGEYSVSSRNDLKPTHIQDPTKLYAPMVKEFLGNQLEKDNLVRVKILASFRKCIGRVLNWLGSLFCVSSLGFDRGVDKGVDKGKGVDRGQVYPVINSDIKDNIDDNIDDKRDDGSVISLGEYMTRERGSFDDSKIRDSKIRNSKRKLNRSESCFLFYGDGRLDKKVYKGFEIRRGASFSC
jgi:hypothetical protein